MKYSTQETDKLYYLPVFNRYPVTLEKARGHKVWDENGNMYIDVLSGIAVNSLGHCHPEVTRAIHRQSKRLVHISNFYSSKPQADLAKKLVSKSGLHHAFFSNSGAEANETAYKLARKFASKNGRGGDIIAMNNCFHGRTLANIATGKPKHQEGFDPIPAGFHKVPFNDLQALKSKISQDTAAIIIELIQGEGGIRIADKSYIESVRKLCNQEGIALIFDEIQTGMGRTGRFFAFEHYGVKPDILTMAKALGNGFPIGATLCDKKITEAIAFGDHGTTFGGNPLACAAALATIKVVEEKELVSRSYQLGTRAMKYIRKAAKKQDAIIDIRGMGLMIGVELNIPGRKVVEIMMENGVLGNVTADQVIRFVPPLNINKRAFFKAIRIFFAALKEATSGQS